MAARLRLSGARRALTLAGLALAVGPALGACRTPETPTIVSVAFASPAPAADGRLTNPTAVLVTFGEAPKAGVTLDVSTTLGVLDPAADGSARRQRTITTTGEVIQSFDFFAGAVPGQGVLTVRSSPDLVVPFSFELPAASPEEVVLRASPSVLGSARVGAAQIEATLLRAEGVASPGTRVRFEPCCARDAGYVNCGLYLDVPPSVFTTELDPRVVRFNAALTFEGERLTRPSEATPTSLSVDVYAYAPGSSEGPAAGSLTCADLKARPAEPSIGHVTLLLTSEKPFDAARDDAGTGGAAGEGQGGAGGMGGAGGIGGENGTGGMGGVSNAGSASGADGA